MFVPMLVIVIVIDGCSLDLDHEHEWTAAASGVATLLLPWFVMVRGDGGRRLGDVARRQECRRSCRQSPREMSSRADVKGGLVGETATEGLSAD